MTVDCSRFSFHPWQDYFGVVMQQGRVQLDADWNEWVAELGRRLQAGTMDILGPAEAGRAVVPSTTPGGFEILAQPGDVTIGVGRVYVDGLLVENHGAAPVEWEPRLAELTGTAALSFFAQPYLPFNAANQPAPANVFNRPVLAGGPHLFYLDVWQREVTHLHDPDLVEKAVGVDTTARLQTVWQVRVLTEHGRCDLRDGRRRGAGLVGADPAFGRAAHYVHRRSARRPESVSRPARRRLQGAREPALPRGDPSRRTAGDRDVQVVARQRDRCDARDRSPRRRAARRRKPGPRRRARLP